MLSTDNPEGLPAKCSGYQMMVQPLPSDLGAPGDSVTRELLLSHPQARRLSKMGIKGIWFLQESSSAFQ